MLPTIISRAIPGGQQYNNCLLNLFCLQLATKWVETFRPKLGFFTFYWLQRGNLAFPPLSPPYNVVSLFELSIENNKHPNCEWKGQGRGVDSFILWSYPLWVQCLNISLSRCTCCDRSGRQIMEDYNGFNLGRWLYFAYTTRGFWFYSQALQCPTERESGS